MGLFGNFFARGSTGPTARAAQVSGAATGALYTIVRLLGSASTLALITGTSSNLTLSGSAIAASSALVGASQTAIVRETSGQLAVEYPVTLTGDGTSPPVTYISTSSLAGIHGDSVVQAGGGTDDTAVIQAWLDSSAAQTYTLMVDRAHLVTGLDQPSGTKVVCKDDTCGLYLKSGSNRQALRNKNRQRLPQGNRMPTDAEMATFDHDGSWIGGTINGNFSGQSLLEGGANSGRGTFNVGAGFYGVRNWTFDATVIYPRAYSVLCATAFGSTFVNRNMQHYSDANGAAPIGCDGIHQNGPCADNTVKIYGKSGDDILAFCATDGGDGDVYAQNEAGPYVGQGPITRIKAWMRPDKAHFGIRVLSRGTGTRVSEIDVYEFTGSVFSRLFEVSNFNINNSSDPAFGKPSVGRITFHGTTTAQIIDPSTDPAGQVNAMIGTGDIDDLAFENLQLTMPAKSVATGLMNTAAGTQNVTFTKLDIYEPTGYVLNGNDNCMILRSYDSILNLKIGSGGWHRLSTADQSQQFLSLTKDRGAGSIDLGMFAMNRVNYAVVWTAGYLTSCKMDTVTMADTPSGATLFALYAGGTQNICSTGYIRSCTTPTFRSADEASRITVPVS